MRRAFILFSFLLVPGWLLAQEALLKFERANEAYREGKYDSAATMYEEIASNGFESPGLYYNLGNARFKLKNIPAAILNYERARRLAPHDEDIAYNLRLANLRIIDKIDAVPEFFLVGWWNGIIGLYSSSGWAAIGIALMWGAVFSGGIVLVVRAMPVRRIFAVIGVGAFLVACFAYVAVASQHRREISERYAIVFSQSIPIKSSPDAKSLDLFVLHEGVKVELLDEVENWSKIRLPDGKIGWIPSEDLQVI